MIAFRDGHEKRIAVIGAGRLGASIISYLARKDEARIIAARRNLSSLEELQNRYPEVIATTDNRTAADLADVIVLTVKPDVVEEVSSGIADLAREKLVISAVAARSIDLLEGLLRESRVARVMTGVFVGDEIAAYTLGSRCIEDDHARVRYVFGESATPVEERFLAERTWIACDTGLIAKGISRKIQTLTKQGLDPALAVRWYASALGAVAARLDEGMTGDEIMDIVAGPKSLTGKIHAAYESEGLYGIVDRWMEETLSTCRRK